MKNNFFKKSYITTENLTKLDVEYIFKETDRMKKIVETKGMSEELKGKILAALFYEPSSRTFSSFITAIQRLGGGFIPIHGISNTSVVKGETLEDTVRVFSSYADIIVIRHPEPGSVSKASKYAYVPVVNAGDGINEHPTQALIDLYTICRKFKEISGLHILIIGDLGHYRPTNSLTKLLALYPSVRLSLASPPEVPLQEEVRKYLRNKNVNFKEYTNFDNLLESVDVLYVTRVKKEYMSEELYQKVKGSYIVNSNTLKKMKKDSIILHCLPRIDEIHTDADTDERSLYLTEQVRNGLYMRMAIIKSILMQ